MAEQVRGFISDSGYVVYDDMPGKHANHEAVRRFVEIGFEEFLCRFEPYKNRSHVEAGYGNAQALADLARELGVDPEGVVAARRAIRTTRRARDGVKDTLEQLRRLGVPFVILSDANHTAEQMRETYASQLGLDGLVTDFITSKDTGQRKPEPGMYRAAYERVGEALDGERPSLSEVAFVGHALDEIEGAYRYGLRPLAVYYEGEREAIAFVPDSDVLEAFPDLLRFCR